MSSSYVFPKNPKNWMEYTRSRETCQGLAGCFLLLSRDRGEGNPDTEEEVSGADVVKRHLERYH